MMRIIDNINDLNEDEKSKYEEIIKRYKITKMYYIESKYDAYEKDFIETDGYKLRVTRLLVETLPIKKWFALILTMKSRSNVNEPYYFYKLAALDSLCVDLLEEKGETIFRNYGNEEDNYVKQENELDHTTYKTLKEIEEDDSKEDWLDEVKSKIKIEDKDLKDYMEEENYE